MQTQQTTFARQAILNTFADIPAPDTDARRINALVKARGRVVGYLLSDGNVVSTEEGVAMARNGRIAGVGVGVRKGNEYLKALPDENEGNNLGNLPSIPIPRGAGARFDV